MLSNTASADASKSAKMMMRGRAKTNPRRTATTVLECPLFNPDSSDQRLSNKKRKKLISGSNKPRIKLKSISGKWVCKKARMLSRANINVNKKSQTITLRICKNGDARKGKSRLKPTKPTKSTGLSFCSKRLVQTATVPNIIQAKRVQLRPGIALKSQLPSMAKKTALSKSPKLSLTLIAK